MAFTHLPSELLDAICHHAQPVDLVALSRTHSTIYPVAQRLLYRNLTISSTSHNLQAVVTLAKRPDLSQHVRSFSLRVDSSTLFKSFLRLISTALSRMSQLISLDLFIDPSASWILPKARSTYPRLLHFSSSFSLDYHVAEFLSNTEALLELEVDGASNGLSVPALPTRSIPHLSHFVGSSHVASAIVPGRPVESIHLPLGDLTEEDVIALANSTSHVAILGATTTSSPTPLLELLVQHMPYLVYLRLMTTCDFSEPLQQSFYEQTAKVLTSFADLKGFELAGIHWGSVQKNQDEEQVWQSQSLVSSISAAEEVDLDSDLYYVY